MISKTEFLLLIYNLLCDLQIGKYWNALIYSQMTFSLRAFALHLSSQENLFPVCGTIYRKINGALYTVEFYFPRIDELHGLSLIARRFTSRDIFFLRCIFFRIKFKIYVSCEKQRIKELRRDSFIHSINEWFQLLEAIHQKSYWSHEYGSNVTGFYGLFYSANI